MKLTGRFAGLLVLMLAALMWSCGGSDSFRIVGKIDGIGTQNLQVVYFSEGAFRWERATAVDGKFSFEGHSRDYTVVDIFTSSRSLVTSFVMKNGDHVECTLELNNPVPLSLKGSKPSIELSRWLHDNIDAVSGENTAVVNASVEKYIADNQDDVVSSVLLTRYYDARGREREADSLLRQITPRARITALTEGFRDGLTYSGDSALAVLGDSLWFVGKENQKVPVDFGARRVTLVYFTAPGAGRTGSNDTMLRRLVEDHEKDKKVGVIEVNDIIAEPEDWANEVDRDSLPWERVWHPGFSSVQALGSRPWVIVADSLGQVHYNGPDLNMAINNASRLCL